MFFLLGDYFEPGRSIRVGCLVTRRIMLLRSPSSTHVRRNSGQRNCARETVFVLGFTLLKVLTIVWGSR